MSRDLILALDQGTTGTTVLILDPNLEVVGRSYQEFEQLYPRPGWVSHDPEGIWSSVVATMRGALQSAGAGAERVAAVGITNQRETTLLWERSTGRPVADAVVWQCRRSAEIVDRWTRKGAEPEVQARTGLLPDAYFSASKIRWLLEEHPGLEDRCRRQEICFGTVDSWLLWKLTGGRVHATEPSNASRTMIYNIHRLEWDEELCRRFGIPREILPEVKPSVGEFGQVERELLGAEVPILGIAGDQQAALFGQACFEPGQVKNTYGTGCFLVMNTGREPVTSKNRLLTTIGWQIDGVTEYALEGSVFSAGSAVQWLRDGLGMIRNAAETRDLATAVESSDGVYMVPAFNGLGAPYWDMYARGTLVGITRGTRREHIVRAVLEATAYQTREVVEAMQADSGKTPQVLRTDGGMVANDFLMQYQADILGVEVERPANAQSTAAGAGCLAGLGAGIFKDRAEIGRRRVVEKTFSPAMSLEQRDRAYRGWKRAVQRALHWVEQAPQKSAVPATS
ncbi:MAG: glycerol kinase GlpK [Armatimonadetes bacterium]|nr:glycerol kinase GlpK [Armatimonadota bacterium]